eukprot:TRINITY_DN56565_c0_g1_i1.p1 TRINITY_DN56565_c0_g1~~TRINITY_DN56565_c0_g1_i1.p1  ORF type:complete len:610 (-),score=65.65 TRINITY_DN56565_c0_g1_i1:179-2008(-)
MRLSARPYLRTPFGRRRHYLQSLSGACSFHTAVSGVSPQRTDTGFAVAAAAAAAAALAGDSASLSRRSRRLDRSSLGVHCSGGMFGFDDNGLGGFDAGLGGGYGGGGFGSGAKSRRQLKVPVSIVTGFLGAGKTTLVTHILQNREGLKVGVVVNDVAEANVDSEVLNFEDADGIVGLQNGCACCSGRDDLFARLRELVESAGVSKRDRGWDRLVVECSGVAEPEGIASELEAMAKRGDPLMKRVFLAGIVCLIDASTFWDSFNSADPGAAAAAIGAGSAQEAAVAAGGRSAGTAAATGAQKPLSALLLSQIESADTVLINKVDLVTKEELSRLMELIRALAPNARLECTTRSAIPLRSLLSAEPIDLDMPAYVPTIENRHTVAVRAALRAEATAPKADSQAIQGQVGHAGGSHGSHGSHGADDCSDCTHGNDGHGGHGHDHGHAHDEGHGHGHAHSHSHDGSSAADCAVCAKEAVAARHAAYGLSSFVYRCNDRVFDPLRLAAVTRHMPVVAASLGFSPIAEDRENMRREAPTDGPFAGVLRSKGFIRVNGGSNSVYYWSHAGVRLEVAPVSGTPSSGGARTAQELVFIGAGMNKERIVKALEECLVSG